MSITKKLERKLRLVPRKRVSKNEVRPAKEPRQSDTTDLKNPPPSKNENEECWRPGEDYYGVSGGVGSWGYSGFYAF